VTPPFGAVKKTRAGVAGSAIPHGSERKPDQEFTDDAVDVGHLCEALADASAPGSVAKKPVADIATQ
jgi:hypothetical protein